MASSFALIVAGLILCAAVAEGSPQAEQPLGKGERGTLDAELLSERVAFLEKRVFELEDQAKRATGTTARSWWFGLGSAKGNANDAGASLSAGDGEGDGHGFQALSHSKRGSLAHVIASGQKKWGDYMALNAAVMADGDVMTLCNIPGRRFGYFATTTDTGSLQVFHPKTGEILLQRKLAATRDSGDEVLPEDSDYADVLSLPTFASSFLVRRNESKMLVGHANGDVYQYHFSEKLTRSTMSPEEDVDFESASSPVRILSPSQLPVATDETDESGEDGVTPADGARIVHMDTFKIGELEPCDSEPPPPPTHTHTPSIPSLPLSAVRCRHRRSNRLTPCPLSLLCLGARARAAQASSAFIW